MTLEQNLIKFGLDQKEAKIYLATLELGPSPVLQIARKSGIKRPTTYVLLDKMTTQGYIAKTYKNKKLLYVAEKPEILLRSIRLKEEIFHETLPELLAIMATTKERPKITIYEGRTGIEQVYSELYESPEIAFFGSPKDINKNFPDVIKKFEQISKKKATVIRDIVSRNPADLAYAKEVAQSSSYEVRTLPVGLDFSIDCAIFGNKIAIFSLKKDFFAVMIESKEVADSFRALHALAWQSATPLETLS